jgi:hypothetical protein
MKEVTSSGKRNELSEKVWWKVDKLLWDVKGEEFWSKQENKIKAWRGYSWNKQDQSGSKKNQGETKAKASRFVKKIEEAKILTTDMSKMDSRMKVWFDQDCAKILEI